MRNRPVENNLFVEPAHDSLMRNWGRVMGWQRADPEALLLQREVHQATRDWEKDADGRRRGGLWHLDPRLWPTQGRLRQDPFFLSGPEAHFIRQSIWWRNVLLATAGALFVLAVVLALVFYLLRQEAVRQRYRAVTQALAAQAPQVQQNTGDDELAALLARLAWKYQRRFGGPSTPVDAALRSVLGQPGFSQLLHGHEGLSNAVAFSSDGRYLLTGGQEGMHSSGIARICGSQSGRTMMDRR